MKAGIALVHYARDSMPAKHFSDSMIIFFSFTVAFYVFGGLPFFYLSLSEHKNIKNLKT